MRPMNCAGISANGKAIKLLESEEEDELLQRHDNTAYIPMAISSYSCKYYSWQLVIPPACCPRLEEGNPRLINEAGYLMCNRCARLIRREVLRRGDRSLPRWNHYNKKRGFGTPKVARQAYERTKCSR